MIPSPLIATYQQYTADSDTVVAWLVKTAVICGYSTDLLTNQPASEQNVAQKVEPKVKRKVKRKVGRRKGKARRLAKGKARKLAKSKARKLARGKARKLAKQASYKIPSDSNTSGMKPEVVPERPKCFISMGDLVVLAEWIVVDSTKACIEVPTGFVFVLDRAISVRKTFCKWYGYSSENDDADSDPESRANQRHDNLVSVLEKIREILQPRMSPKIPKEPLVQPIEKMPTLSEIHTLDNNHIFNLHESLAEELFEPFLNTEPVTAGQDPSSISQVEYRLGRVLDLDEAVFAFRCLFHDFHVIRIYLQQVWGSYKQGTTDLVAASITTNTAIDLARELQEGFTEVFPSQANFVNDVNSFYLVTCSNDNYDPEFRACPDDEMNFEAYEYVEPLLFPTLEILASFNDHLEEGNLPSFTGHCEWYDPRNPREWMLPKWKFREDKALLFKVLPEFCVVAHADGNIPVEDAMTCGVREMMKEDYVPLLLIFATQVYLDIHHILREKVCNGFHDLIKSARYVENNIQRILELQLKLHLENWPKSKCETLLKIRDVIRTWINSDAVQEARINIAQAVDTPETPAEAFSFFKYHPWYCGLLSYSINASAREASIIFINALGSILSSAHLYNALRQERQMTNPWPDMELVLLMHKTEDLFVGAFPNAAADYHERFFLAMEHLTKNSTQDRMQDGIAARKSSPRKLNQLPQVCGMFKDRFSRREIRLSLSSDDIKVILNLEDTREFWKIAKFSINVNLIPAPSAGENQPVIKFYSHLGKQVHGVAAIAGMKPIHFLNTLCNAIRSEALELTFDYFGLHYFCWTMFRTLRDVLQEGLNELYGQGCLGKLHQLPLVVGYILGAASHTNPYAEEPSPAGPSMLLWKQKCNLRTWLLSKAAEIVSEFLHEGYGEFEIDAIKQLGVPVPHSLDFWDIANEESDGFSSPSSPLAAGNT